MSDLFDKFAIEVGFRITAEVGKVRNLQVRFDIIIHKMHHTVDYVFRIFLLPEAVTVDVDEKE